MSFGQSFFDGFVVKAFQGFFEHGRAFQKVMDLIEFVGGDVRHFAPYQTTEPDIEGSSQFLMFGCLKRLTHRIGQSGDVGRVGTVLQFEQGFGHVPNLV